MAAIYQPQSGDWQHGLFDCFDDCGDCLCASFCAPCYAYVAAQEMDESFCTALINCLFYPMCLCCLRGAARNKRGIEGGITSDFIATWCCPCCAAIQMKREFSP